MVGIPVLAHKLVQIQSVIISKCLPEIVKKINERLNVLILELNKLPQSLTSIPDAMTAFIRIGGSLKETLHMILIRGEFDQESNNKQMYFDARLVEMLDQLSKELHTSFKFSENFLVEEIQVLKEANGIRLPHTLRPNVFYHLLQREVNNISSFPISFVNKVWGYLEVVCLKVLIDHCGNYPQFSVTLTKYMILNFHITIIMLQTCI
ncbi:dynamin central domain-containing protein [Artemisia annua]|uniref:Dynamin central domain-containing protein n=1 Tax=Artemisia annua TaxID=35608 RepID=A0A2U1N7R1_ARTAN|nr:dynamin central domain-containing protein [Artemisia annua]